jgi:hypothetical protein
MNKIKLLFAGCCFFSEDDGIARGKKRGPPVDNSLSFRSIISQWFLVEQPLVLSEVDCGFTRVRGELFKFSRQSEILLCPFCVKTVIVVGEL